MLKDAAARTQTSVTGDDGEQGRRDGGQRVQHTRPRRARRQRAVRVDDVHRDAENVNAAGEGTHEDTARLGLKCEGVRKQGHHAEEGRVGPDTLWWEH